LEQNYPNPFNPSTTIRFAIPKTGMTRLIVYDILGREVRTLMNSDLNAGYHQIVWNGRNNSGSQVASGMYLYRIEAGSFISIKKMMLLK
jgi:flagellar hook assembly protein FlgD